MIIPIRTETEVRQTPLANYVLVALNALAYMLLDLSRNPHLQQFKLDHLVLHTAVPSLHQFVTYQFIHGDGAHLLGNMLFLWVFGNAVNGKLGNVAYLLYYLAAGVFAAVGFAWTSSADLLGASGSIAGVTTAYLVLFPRSHVTVLYWLLIIGTFELPAMLIIGIKIVLWDNVIAPQIYGPGMVATGAHLAGYIFGVLATVFMLLIRVVPRDQFDMLALFKRWNQRRAYRATMADPTARARAQFGRVARTIQASPARRQAEERQLDQISGLRLRINECLERDDVGAAAALYDQLIGIDPHQCLPARHQITVAREFYSTGRPPQAAAAFERYLASYASADDADEIRLLLGIIYARDLGQHLLAEGHLSAALENLTDQARRAQCDKWLAEARAALGKPTSDK